MLTTNNYSKLADPTQTGKVARCSNDEWAKWGSPSGTGRWVAQENARGWGDRRGGSAGVAPLMIAHSPVHVTVLSSLWLRRAWTFCLPGFLDF